MTFFSDAGQPNVNLFFLLIRLDATKFGFLIDLFTHTAAILNLLDLRSIMGCPGSTRSVFTRTFRAKREPYCIFLGKKEAHNYIQTRHNGLFFPLQSFSRKT